MLLITQEPDVSSSFYAASYNTASNEFTYATGSGNTQPGVGTNDLSAEYSIFNYLLLQAQFFSGSLIADASAGGSTDSDAGK